MAITAGLGFLFPGQGSQAVGMLGELAIRESCVEATFREASEALGYDLWALVQSGPETELNRTECTQPAMLAAGVAVWRAWQRHTALRPSMMAGHSLGEYTALVCAGALDFRDAVKIVAERGRLMQAAVPNGNGAMAAVLGMQDEVLREVCAASAQGGVVSCANFNAPGQIVIGGDKAAVERAAALARAKGALKIVPIAMSVPSHCDLMYGASRQLAAKLEAIAVRAPNVPILHNVDVASHALPEEIRNALADQLYRPVRWVEVVRAMASKGIGKFIECGPGKVLAGLVRRIDRNLTCLPVHDPDSLAEALAALNGATHG
jgi:[acyl-carrier-protein] S-malonyltransferase